MASHFHKSMKTGACVPDFGLTQMDLYEWELASMNGEELANHLRALNVPVDEIMAKMEERLGADGS